MIKNDPGEKQPETFGIKPQVFYREFVLFNSS